MMHSSLSARSAYIRFSGDKYRRFIDLEAAASAPTIGALPPSQHGSYGALLLDPRWKARRADILERDSHQCVICRTSKQLQVHHRQYHFRQNLQQFSPPWDYPDELMITLCERCHQRGHQQYTVPSINI